MVRSKSDGTENGRGPLEEALHLLDLHERGILSAYLTTDERREQRLSPLLNAGERAATRELLTRAGDPAAAAERIRSLGEERSLALLQLALSRPMVPVGPTIYRVSPMIERHL